MKLLLRLVLVAVLLLGAFAAYLALAPAPIDPVAWEPPPVPAMEGPLAPNQRLAAATLIAAGKIDGPEDIETDAKGRLTYITDAVVIGEGRRYLTALVMIDLEHVARHAQASPLVSSRRARRRS